MADLPRPRVYTPPFHISKNNGMVEIVDAKGEVSTEIMPANGKGRSRQ